LRAVEAAGGAAGLAQAVFDAMFADMDFNLRELGVGDMSIGRRVRAMWEAFHGRALAYEGPLSAGDAAALEAALIRNVWRGDAEAAVRAATLAQVALAQDAHLRGQDASALAAGQVDFIGARRAIAVPA
jgi:cytochrome b pre-mRNA-processing protein 3